MELYFTRSARTAISPVSKRRLERFAGPLVRLKADGNGIAAEQVYFIRGLPNGLGGAVLVGDHLYGTEAAQKLIATDFVTGKIKWEAENFGWASVAAADGHLYLHLIMSGEMVLVEATSEGFREKGRFTPAAPPKHKQSGPYPEGAFTYPVIANGRLYIRDLGTLWAYDIKG